MRLFSGAAAIDESVSPRAAFANTVDDVRTGEIAALKAYVIKLEADVSELRTMVAKLSAELGDSTS
jgi:hypothetical protein